MLITLDKYGRLTLPGSLRQKLGLDKETYLELSVEDGGVIVLHPVNVQRTVRLKENGLKKLDEARKSGTSALPDWLAEDMKNAETETDQQILSSAC